MQKTRKRINYCRLFLREGSFHRTKTTVKDTLVGTGGGSFSYLAPMFDTMDIDSSFHRFLLYGEFIDCKYEVIVAATNVDLSEVLFSEGITPKEQEQVLCDLKFVRNVNNNDFLLHDLEGRYIWVLIRVSGAKFNSRFEIKSFEVEFPKSSFVSYLPEIYQNQKDTFFHRYMAALQSLYEHLETKVEDVPALLDFETTEEDTLNELSGWVGFYESKVTYKKEQLRVLIGDLTEIQAGKGTAKILKKMLTLLTGKEVYVVEYFKWHDLIFDNKNLLEDFSRIYGLDESVFTILIDFRGTQEADLPDKEWVMHVVEEYAPFGLKCNLVYLTESNHLDTHCYLDVNSYLSTPVTADTKGFLLGGNFVLG